MSDAGGRREHGVNESNERVGYVILGLGGPGNLGQTRERSGRPNTPNGFQETASRYSLAGRNVHPVTSGHPHPEWSAASLCVDES